jgi:hypothetical protein
MGTMSLNFSSSVIGISYGEMNSIKSNLRRANDMLMQSQSKVNSARLKVQVDRGSSRLRVSEEQLNDLYRNAAKRKTKIDKLCNNIDITIRKFKEVDSRCAARIRAIGKSYDKDKSLWERIKSYVSSFFSHGASSLKSMYETGMDAFNALKKDTVEAYNAASEWLKEHSEVMDTLETIGGVAQTAAYALLLVDPATTPIAIIGILGTTFSASSTLESISKLINYSSTGKNEGINVVKMGFEGLGELVGGEKGKSVADGVFSTIDTVAAIGGLFIDGGLTISKAGQVMKNSEESISVFKALSEGAKLAEDLKYNSLTDLLKGPFKGSLDNLIDVGKNFKDIFIPPTNFGKMCFAGIDDVSMGGAGAIEEGLGKAGALDGLSRNAEILGMIGRITEIGSEFIGGGDTKGGSKAESKLQKSAQDIIDKASSGKIKYAKNYHGRLGKELETDILSNPDAVYVSGNKSQNLIYRKGDNVVIVESGGSSKGNVITSYGPDGARGNSGAAIFGGSPSDPGMPVTHDAIVNGNIPTPSGETMPPATQIYP